MIRVVILLGFIFTSVYVSGQNLRPMADTAAFKKGLEHFSKTTQTIQGEFIQEKRLKLLNDKVISKGLLWFKKENKLRWEYSEPFSYIVVLNGGKVALKDEGKVSRYDAASNKLFMELNDILITCINGNIFLSNKFSYRFLESEKSNVVELLPVSTSMKSFLEKIVLYFDKGDYSVSKVDMIEPSQNSTVIAFKNKKLNAEIPDQNFILN
jgi:outer membrane lipoprotein-sorting protein